MKKVLTAAAFALAAVCVAMYMGGRSYSRTEYMLDTIITVTADERKAVSACFDEISRIENLLSAYLPDSEISKINSAPSGEGVEVSEEVFSLLERAQQYKQATDGAFDISIKPVVDLWDIGGEGNVPDDESLLSALECVGDIVLDKSNHTVTLPRDGMGIDLGGIAKGYAGDRVREILKEHGVRSAIADLGGNIVTVGKNGKRPWRIGLQDPKGARGTSFADISIEDSCVVTSGGYERYFEKDGKTYHHIIDPNIGKNPDNGILSVTIIAQDGTLADALSTAVFVAGKDRGIDIAERLGVEAVIFANTGVYHTDGVKLNIHTEK